MCGELSTRGTERDGTSVGCRSSSLLSSRNALRLRAGNLLPLLRHCSFDTGVSFGAVFSERKTPGLKKLGNHHFLQLFVQDGVENILHAEEFELQESRVDGLGRRRIGRELVLRPCGKNRERTQCE